MRRTALLAFSLSLLDVICCGFGAVIMQMVIASARVSPVRVPAERTAIVTIGTVYGALRNVRDNRQGHFWHDETLTMDGMPILTASESDQLLPAWDETGTSLRTFTEASASAVALYRLDDQRAVLYGPPLGRSSPPAIRGTSRREITISARLDGSARTLEFTVDDGWTAVFGRRRRGFSLVLPLAVDISVTLPDGHATNVRRWLWTDDLVQASAPGPVRFTVLLSEDAEGEPVTIAVAP